MKFIDNVPIYVQIANDIKEQISAGKLADGDKLDSIREFSLAYEVTALTMQRAMALLEQEDIVETKKGVGSFVKTGVGDVLKINLVQELVRDFVARAIKMGFSHTEIMAKVKEELGHDERVDG